MIFFADINTNMSNYCLTHVNKLNDPRIHNKKIIIIDPKISDLKTNFEYKYIDLLHKKVLDLKENEYITIDYCSDKNILYEDLFINKTNENNQKYANIDNYFVTIQYRLNDIESFKENFNKNKYIWENNDKKIIGIGNLCRIFKPTEFTDKLFNFINSNLKQKRIHIFGLSTKNIRKYIPEADKINQISIDNTKWTRAVRAKLQKRFGRNCSKKLRNFYFDVYLGYISENINIEF